LGMISHTQMGLGFFSGKTESGKETAPERRSTLRRGVRAEGKA